MKFSKANIPFRILLVLTGIVLLQENLCRAASSLPKGVMLNLDFQNIENGLIPNKTLYPLFVPLDNLGTESINNRKILAFQEGQSLEIPHSSLLDPAEDIWVISLRFFALSNGIIMSQGNTEKGYVIYLKDNDLYAAVRTGHTTVIMEGSAETDTTGCLNRWITTELKIKRNSAMFSINRKKVDLVPLHYSFTGQGYKIRFGQQTEIPAPFKQTKPVPANGFTGGISSVKILRQ
jgi:hypothetical protein